MGDLISRGKLFNLLAPVQTLGEAYGIIQGMDTVDAVPVVRCQDCKWYQPDADKWCGYFECMGFEPDNYCSQGERKGGKGNENH